MVSPAGAAHVVAGIVVKYPLFGAMVVKRNAPYRDRAFSNTEKDQYPLGGLVITGLYLAGSKYKAIAY